MKTDIPDKTYFVCGIGGSGMLPLAVILKGMGYNVAGSDRSYDQGRTPEKFQWILDQGIPLFPQDGSGVTGDVGALVISKAVEDTIPDIRAAKEKDIPIQRRVDMLIDLFNQARLKIAIAGTSGKTTTTGMTGFILKEAGLDPTVMNGGVFRNYMQENPYSTAFVGQGGIFVSEVDESDGKDAVTGYHPDIAIIHNITLDHQPMSELKDMFGAFLEQTRTAVLNIDDQNVIDVAQGFRGKVIRYSLQNRDADYYAGDVTPRPDGLDAVLSHHGEKVRLSLHVPGLHNLSNALAAIAACVDAGVPFKDCVSILSRFTGIRRRMEVVGIRNEIVVMDDFAHNPDKLAATLGALKEFPGRLHIFFQPHGYGFLKLLGQELAQSFADHLSPEDRLYMVEPFYAGGTVDRSAGSAQVIEMIRGKGRDAMLVAGRPEALALIKQTAQPGDRIVVMGARDDSLSDFARQILAALR